MHVFPTFIPSSQFVSQQDASYLYLTINPLPSFQSPDLPVVIWPTSRLLVLPVSLLKYLKRSGGCTVNTGNPYAKAATSGVCSRGIIICYTRFMSEKKHIFHDTLILNMTLCCMLSLTLSSILSLSLCVI